MSRDMWEGQIGVSAAFWALVVIVGCLLRRLHILKRRSDSPSVTMGASEKSRWVRFDVDLKPTVPERVFYAEPRGLAWLSKNWIWCVFGWWLGVITSAVYTVVYVLVQT